MATGKVIGKLLKFKPTSRGSGSQFSLIFLFCKSLVLMRKSETG